MLFVFNLFCILPGIPFIMYIVLNNTVREEIFSCCKKNPASSQVKIHSTTVHSFN